MTARSADHIARNYRIRPAEPDDVERLPEIEREAAALFAGHVEELGFPAGRLPEVNSVATFRRAQEAGRLWVAVNAENRAVGFALATEIDGRAHLEEIDVRPAEGRKGLGSALVETVCAWAKAEGYPAVTLSTFRDVPWNGPFYLRCGFFVVDPSALSPGLERLVEMERAKGLRSDLRVIMKKDLPAAGEGAPADGGTMRAVLASLEAEYGRYKALGDAALAQLTDRELNECGPHDGNSAAIVAWHLAGNLRARFTDFLTADGEKPWRDREKEFDRTTRTREELREHWERGWQALFGSLARLSDAHLPETVLIRGTELKVHEALHRSLAHASYHVGQIVYIAKGLRGPRWQYLSIPPGGSEDYNRNPTSERAEAQASRLNTRLGDETER